MAKVEGMPLAALENGVDWSWRSFGEYLDRLDGKIAVNAGFLVGHCALRRYVMGEDAVGSEATPEQIDEMVRLLHAVARAGGIGLLDRRSAYTHPTATASRSPSRAASKDELLRCAARCASTRARRSRASSRAASTGSPTTRSSCWPRCRWPPAAR